MEFDTLPEGAQECLSFHLNKLLSARQYPKTICPSEVVRALTAEELAQAGVTSWRELMPTIRTLVWTRRRAGDVEVLQHGELVDTDTTLDSLKGPIRVRIVKQH